MYGKILLSLQEAVKLSCETAVLFCSPSISSKGVSRALYPQPQLVSRRLWIWTMWAGVSHSAMCDSLMTDDGGHMFICLFALFIFSLMMSIHIFCPLLHPVVCFLIVEWTKFYIYTYVHIYIGSNSSCILDTT